MTTSYINAILPITPEIIEQVEKTFNRPGYGTCTWEHPGQFEVWTGGTLFVAGVPGHNDNLIMVELSKDWEELTSWAIPYKGKLSAKKMIKAIEACMHIYETEEI